MKDPEDLTIADVERALKEPASQWHGRCFEIAWKIVRAKLVRGTAVYGHYRGPIARTGYWAGHRGRVVIHHGWIVLDESTDGRLLDPTRFSFEDRKPYLHLHDCFDHELVCHCGHVVEEHDRTFVQPCLMCNGCIGFEKEPCDYDEGGNRFRAAMARPCPPFDPKDRKKNLHLSTKVRDFVMALTGRPPHLTHTHLFWLANLPLSTLGPYADEIFQEFERIGEAALIPVDNRLLVARRAGRKAE